MLRILDLGFGLSGSTTTFTAIIMEWTQSHIHTSVPEYVLSTVVSALKPFKATGVYFWCCVHFQQVTLIFG